MPWRMPRHGSPMPPADWPSSTVDQMALNRPHRGAKADRRWSSYAPPSHTGSPHCRAGQADRYRNPGITVSHLALAKALTSNLAELAAEASAAIAAVDVNVAGQAVTAIRINLVAVGAADRDSTYIDDGDALRKRAAAVVTDIIGIEPPNITVTWEDIVLPSY